MTRGGQNIQMCQAAILLPFLACAHLRGLSGVSQMPQVGRSSIADTRQSDGWQNTCVQLTTVVLLGSDWQPLKRASAKRPTILEIYAKAAKVHTGRTSNKDHLMTAKRLESGCPSNLLVGNPCAFSLSPWFSFPRAFEFAVENPFSPMTSGGLQLPKSFHHSMATEMGQKIQNPPTQKPYLHAGTLSLSLSLARFY